MLLNYSSNSFLLLRDANSTHIRTERDLETFTCTAFFYTKLLRIVELNRRNKSKGAPRLRLEFVLN